MNPPPNQAQRWREARSAKAVQPVAAPQVEAEKAVPPRRKRLAPKAALMLDVEGALTEITLVPAATIHRTAAYQWASRAIACYRVCAGKSDLQQGLSFLYLGEHYREAALAHAAMGDAWQPLLREVEDVVSDDRGRAFDAMRRRSTDLNDP